MKSAHFFLVLSLAFFLGYRSRAQNSEIQPSYPALISQGNALMKQGKFDEATAMATQAIKMDANRYQGYALRAFILSKQGKTAEADAFMEMAIDHAPADKQSKLADARKEISQAGKDTKVAMQTSAKPDSEVREKLETFKLILADADAAKGPERKKYLDEFLTKSKPFIEEYPDQIKIWTLRAATAVELGDSQVGWQAGQRLKTLDSPEKDDSSVVKVMASLDRKGWLTQSKPNDASAFVGKWNFLHSGNLSSGKTADTLTQIKYADFYYEFKLSKDGELILGSFNCEQNAKFSGGSIDGMSSYTKLSYPPGEMVNKMYQKDGSLLDTSQAKSSFSYEMKYDQERNTALLTQHMTIVVDTQVTHIDTVSVFALDSTKTKLVMFALLPREQYETFMKASPETMAVISDQSQITDDLINKIIKTHLQPTAGGAVGPSYAVKVSER